MDRERLSEEDRAKGIILIAPDFLSSPLCDPGARFLVFPPPFSPAPAPRSVASTASSFPRAGSSKSFLRLIFPSNLHAAVIKGLGRGTSSGASTDAAGGSKKGKTGVGFSARGPDSFETMASILSAGFAYRNLAREISASKASAILLSIFSLPLLRRD